MEPLESGQIQPLELSHAIGPPGWRPYFQAFGALAPPNPPPAPAGPLAASGSPVLCWARGGPWPLLAKAEVGIEGASPKP